MNDEWWMKAHRGIEKHVEGLDALVGVNDRSSPHSSYYHVITPHDSALHYAQIG